MKVVTVLVAKSSDERHSIDASEMEAIYPECSGFLGGQVPCCACCKLEDGISSWPVWRSAGLEGFSKEGLPF